MSNTVQVQLYRCHDTRAKHRMYATAILNNKLSVVHYLDFIGYKNFGFDNWVNIQRYRGGIFHNS